MLTLLIDLFISYTQEVIHECLKMDTVISVFMKMEINHVFSLGTNAMFVLHLLYKRCQSCIECPCETVLCDLDINFDFQETRV